MKTLLVLLSLLVAALQPAAQTAPPAQAAAASATRGEDAVQPDDLGPPVASIRVTTGMVLLDVLATDRHGDFIGDLTADNFSVLEDGVAQKIVYFSRTMPGQHVHLHDESAQKQPTTLFTNRPDPEDSQGLVLILLDGLNTAASDQAYARQQALRFLRNQLKPDQKVAVFALSNELLLLQDFTDRTSLLLKAIESFVPGKSRVIAQGEPFMISPEIAGLNPRLLEALARFNQERAIDSISARVRITESALNAIARSMIGRRGRKSLIWISAGFPSVLMMPGKYSDLSRDFYDEMQKTSALLLRAQIAVYPVDVRGLVADPAEFESDALVPTVMSSENSSFGDEDMTRSKIQLDASQEGMRELASETGGHAFYNGNDLSKAISRAVAESGSYYTLGYYPTNKNWNGKFRKIDTRVARAKVSLTGRRGYYAIDPAEAQTELPSDRSRELAAAIVDPLPSTGVLFTAHVTLSPKETYQVDFVIDSATLSFEPGEKGRLSCTLDFSAAILTSKGKFNRVTQTAMAQIPATQYQSVRERGLAVHIQIGAVEKETSIRLAVRDRRSGLLGSLTIPLPLPRPAN